MDILAPFSSGDVDLRLSGHVSYASGSSLEVLVRLSTIPQGDIEPTTILLGRFAMACRSSATGGKHPVTKLIVEGPVEEELYAMGEENKSRKKEVSAKSVWKTAPSEEESQILHDLFIGRANIFGTQSIPLSTVKVGIDVGFRRERSTDAARHNLHVEHSQLDGLADAPYGTERT